MIKTFSVSHMGQPILCYSELVRFYCPSVIKSLKIFEIIESYLVIKRELIISASLVLSRLLLKVRDIV